MPNRLQTHVLIWAGLLLAILLLVDRYYWAHVSQWREDQATNMWLGYTAGLRHIPVGLISSRGIPNPNGMILVGFFMSALPSLLSVSFVLGVVQIVLVVLVGWRCFGRNWQYLSLATIPPLSSVILRSTSVELWNQCTITLINLSFLFWALRYLWNQSLWNVPPIVVLILLAPSLYLAGIANAMAMTLLTIGLIAYARPRMDGIRAMLTVTTGLTLASVFFTWLPYIQNVDLERVTGYNEARMGPAALIRAMWESVVRFPIYGALQWADDATVALAFKHSDPELLSASTQLLLWTTGRIYLLQAVFACTTVSYVLYVALLKRITVDRGELKVNEPVARIVVLSASFVALSFAFAAWLGGPAWMYGERPDQVVQFLPMFLLLMFLSPFAISVGGRAGTLITRVSYAALIAFSALSLLCGFMTIRDHLRYRGDALTEADIPLIDKMQAVDFIAMDWRRRSESNVIPVDYELGGGVWNWVPAFGSGLARWYPAPMTTGRSYDYDLLRRYGLKNQQEGIQLRTFGAGRYLVTYAFEEPPKIEGGHITHHVRGRLRVSIVDK